MTRLLQRLAASLNQLVKPARDWVLAKLRAQVAFAVNDDFRRLVLHVTAERHTLTSELAERMAAELAPLRRQLDDLNVCTDGLLREVVRLQREVQQLLEAVERLPREMSSASRSFDDEPHLKFVDQRREHAA